MTTFLIQVSAAGFAQKVTFTKKDASLKQLFTEIRNQTGYNVFFQEGKVNDELKIDAAFKNAPLEEVLTKALSARSLTYTIVNKTIVVKKKELNFMDKVKSFFEAISVEGKVYDDESGKPLQNVTITIKGTNRKIVSNEAGYFRFSGVPDNAVLVFSNIGYETRELTARESIEIKLKLATQTLNDVIVSTGYQQIKKGSTTGSYTVISADEIASTPSINLMERLEGKVPGVQFDLRKNTVQIRGVNNYTNPTTPPLIVIDGFPAINQSLTTITSGSVVSSPTFLNQPETSGNAILSTFNPADIESITFLKDAAASAIWGSKAANGVIVITTKRGKKGTSSINFGSTFGISAPANLSNLTTMSNRDYISLEQELVDKGFITDPATNYRNSAVTEAEEWMFKVKRRTASVAQRDSALNVLANRSNKDQLNEYLLQKAVTQQYNLSSSGGADNSSYYVSGSYNKDRPVFKSNGAQTYSMISNFTNDFLKKRITVATGLSYNYSKSQVNSAALQALGAGSFGLAPYEMLVDPQGNRISKAVAFTPRVSDSLARIGYLPWTYNAIDELNYNNTINTSSAIRANASVKGVVTSWLNLSVSGQVQKTMAEQTLVQNLASYTTRNLINTGTVFTNKKASYGVPVGAVYKNSRTTSDDYNLRAQFDINKNWNDKHHFDMIGGTEIRQSKYNSGSQTLYGYNEDISTSVVVNPTVNYPTIFGSTTQLGFNDGTIYLNTKRYLSYFSNATYSYLNRYFVTGSVRFDDYSLIGVDRRHRATPLWSTGLKWDVKKESFMDQIRWISDLSLRGTYGSGGTVPSAGQAYTTIGLGSSDLNTLLPYASINAPANQSIGWETTKTTNGGLDADFFNSRLSVSVDVYHKNTDGILVGLPFNSTYGWSNLTYNAGTLIGHGAEVNLNGQIVRSRNWSWSSNFNISYNTNKVTDSRFPSTVATVGNVLTTGYPVDNLFVYRWAGLDNTGQSQIYAANGSILKSTGSPAVKAEDRVYAGRTTAPYFGGFSNTVRYHNLSLMVRATYYLGNKFLLQNINSSSYPNSAGFNGLINNSEALATRWRNPGDEATTNVPGLTGINFNSLSRYINSDLNVRDGGNIRLQQITLNYSIPQNILRKMGFIKAVNVGATVSNLGLLWVANKEGIDPNYQMTSTYTNLPPSRNYLFNLNLTL